VLHKLDVLPENVYNIDKTSVMLSILNSVKVLVSKNNTHRYSSLSLYSITKPNNALTINHAYLFRIVSERIKP
jgi:hypothetical protein